MAETTRVWLKDKCKRRGCGGNLYLERDWFGEVKAVCLLCSREFGLTPRQQRQVKKEGLKVW